MGSRLDWNNKARDGTTEGVRRDGGAAGGHAVFWARGYVATSIRHLSETMGISGASLYNAFSDKRALYPQALCHSLERSVHERAERLSRLAPAAAIRAFFDEMIERSAGDPDHRGSACCSASGCWPAPGRTARCCSVRRMV